MGINRLTNWWIRGLNTIDAENGVKEVVVNYY